jgi:hypothetical protein
MDDEEFIHDIHEKYIGIIPCLPVKHPGLMAEKNEHQ